MNDIVERLRQWVGPEPVGELDKLMMEAADEIERLRREIPLDK